MAKRLPVDPVAEVLAAVPQPLTDGALRSVIGALDAQPEAVLDGWLPDGARLGVRVRRRVPGGRLTAVWTVRARPKGGDSVRVRLGDARLLGCREARRQAAPHIAALMDGSNPLETLRHASKQRAALRDRTRRTWQDVLEAHANPAHPSGRRPGTLAARRVVARWSRRALDEDSTDARVTALRAAARLSLADLLTPHGAEVMVAALRPLLDAPASAPTGRFAGPESAAPWGPWRSRSSAIKLLTEWRAAWRAEPTLRDTPLPWQAWQQQARTTLRTPPPKTRALVLRDATRRLDPSSTGARWVRALLAVRERAYREQVRTGARSAMPAQVDCLLLVLLLGSRLTETALLTWADVEWEANPVPHIKMRDTTTKGRRAILRPLLPAARALLDARRAALTLAQQRDDSQWIFPGAQHRHAGAPEDAPPTAEHWSGASLVPVLDAVVAEADPEAVAAFAAARQAGKARPHAHAVPSPLWVSPHDVRRTLAGWLAGEPGMSPLAAEMALGHAAGGVTAGYRTPHDRLLALLPVYERWEHALATVAPELPGAVATDAAQGTAPLTAAQEAQAALLRQMLASADPAVRRAVTS